MKVRPGFGAFLVAAPFIPLFVAAKVAASRKARCAPEDQASAGSRSRRSAHGAAASRTPQAAPDIVDTAVQAGSFKTLVQAVQAAGLVDTLKSPGPFTVLAPSDEAFAKLPAGALEGLLSKPEQLAEVLKLHVIPGRVNAANLAGVERLRTVQGQSLAVDTSRGVRIGAATVVQADIATSNGVIHAIDTVLLPE